MAYQWAGVFYYFVIIHDESHCQFNPIIVLDPLKSLNGSDFAKKGPWESRYCDPMV